MIMEVKLLETAKQVVAKVSKSLGEGAIMLMSSAARTDVEVISTGSLGLDRALGVQGIPRGRIVEVFGPEASGKTTLTLNLVAQTQKAGGLAAFVDAEHAIDCAYAERIGVDMDALLIAQPDSGEEALDIVESLICAGNVDLIVVDSVAALVPRAEIEGKMGDHHMGLQARLMSQALRKLAPIAHKANCTVVFINQIRMKIGSSYGSPETTTGGRALRFYASVRLDIRRIASLKDGDRVYGSRTRVKVVKNKLAPPHCKCEFDIIFGLGIDTLGELVELGVELGHCKKSGAWFGMGDQRLGQGRQNAAAYLADHPEAAVQLEEQIRKSFSKEDPRVVNQRKSKAA
jgi:recombination protein RecA